MPPMPRRVAPRTIKPISEYPNDKLYLYWLQYANQPIAVRTDALRDGLDMYTRDQDTAYRALRRNSRFAEATKRFLRRPQNKTWMRTLGYREERGDTHFMVDTDMVQLYPYVRFKQLDKNLPVIDSVLEHYSAEIGGVSRFRNSLNIPMVGRYLAGNEDPIPQEILGILIDRAAAEIDYRFRVTGPHRTEVEDSITYI